MKIVRFEEIKAWQEARLLTRQIYALTDKGPFAKDFGLRDQIRRASVSIMSNIAEGFLSQTNKYFIKYLFISLASTAEVQSQLYVALDRNYLTKEEFGEIFKQSQQVAKLINGFITYLKQHTG